MDIPFVFDNVQIAASMTGGGPEAQGLASQMSDSFIAFARNGDPNNASIPKWHRFDLARRATLCWNTQTLVKSDPRSQERQLIEQIAYTQPGA